MTSRKVCENCGREMEIIFILTNVPLYIISGERALKFIHTAGKDIFQNKWWSRWLPTIAKYVMGFRCVTCQIMWLNYGKTHNEKDVQSLIQGN